MSQSQKDSPWNGNTLISDKHEVTSAAVSKEGHADSFLGRERTYHYQFSLKKLQLLTVLPTAFSFNQIHLIYWMIHVYGDENETHLRTSVTSFLFLIFQSCNIPTFVTLWFTCQTFTDFPVILDFIKWCVSWF